jgi:hypothetical protein
MCSCWILLVIYPILSHNILFILFYILRLYFYCVLLHLIMSYNFISDYLLVYLLYPSISYDMFSSLVVIPMINRLYRKLSGPSHLILAESLLSAMAISPQLQETTILGVKTWSPVDFPNRIIPPKRKC